MNFETYSRSRFFIEQWRHGALFLQFASVAAGRASLIVFARSEEHTSEPSHSQISYAVFCLKKKNNQHIDLNGRASYFIESTLRERRTSQIENASSAQQLNNDLHRDCILQYRSMSSTCGRPRN